MGLFPLVLNVDTDHFAIAAFSYSRHVKSVAPQFTALKFFAEIEMTPEQLTRCNTLYQSYDLRRRMFWGCTQQVMDVIRVYPHLFEFDRVSFFDFFTYRLEALFPVKMSKYPFSIFHGHYKVIMDLIGIMLRFLDRSHTLQSLHKESRAASRAE